VALADPVPRDAPRARVEFVEDGRYARTVAIGSARAPFRGWFRVGNNPLANQLTVELSESLAPAAADVLARIRALFDLDARPDVIDEHLALDPRLAPLVRELPGLRVPGAFDGFELGWRTILGQQVSVPAATTMSGRVASQFGAPIETPIPALNRLSPEPRRLASAARTSTCASASRARASARCSSSRPARRSAAGATRSAASRSSRARIRS
jgi:AraC family transcriptional regulator of adaptative response / DNA-3-methyladenine glycosylase II